MSAEWTEEEILEYLNRASAYQRVFLAALAHLEREPAPISEIVLLLRKISAKTGRWWIRTNTAGQEIGGAYSGLIRRRKNLGKTEDIVERVLDERTGEPLFRLNEKYKDAVIKWLKEKGLWIKR
ncbi:MAG: hypothetical protein ABIM74_06630 [candidate division WOR-3 bacterium]